MTGWNSFFDFQRGYGTTERSEFVLKVIKWDYNANERLKFILTLIKWGYGLNDRSKIA